MATLVCLHSSGSSARQWARLAAALAPGHRVLAPDLIGYGSDEPPDFDGEVTLDAEAARVERAMKATRGPVVLVGHSYGAAVAMRVALRRPGRIAGLALYEPVLFSLIARGDGSDGAWRDIRTTGGAIVADVCAGRVAQAAARFVDYWSGAGTWQAMDGRRRDAVCARMGKVAQEFAALFDDLVPLAVYARLAMPVLLLEGETTPAPPRAVGRSLLPVLPDAAHLRIAGAGHMGPITHPDVVNAEILRFVRAIDRRQRLGIAA